MKTDTVRKPRIDSFESGMIVMILRGSSSGGSLMQTANACEDHDDADASAQGFVAYEDLDGDGFGSDSSAVFICALDEDGDGIQMIMSIWC